MDSSEDENMYNYTPPELAEKAKNIVLNLLPDKSREKYELQYKLFMSWLKKNNGNKISENILLACFSEKAKVLQSPTLWSTYSMLKATMQLPDLLSDDMEDLVVLQTKLGKLRGRIKHSTFSNKKYYSFVGIPFGKPPIGEHRFKAPLPFGGWEAVRDALEDGHETKQPVYFRRPGMDPNQETQGDEDCLYLCVYMTEFPEESCTKKPVMVNIHGGGFAGGSGDSKSAGPDYLMEGDVVLVSFNYRCGALGFLSLENEEVPGNAGLKDQTLALKWVQDNIDSFGGDPHNVTIFGISAGGASVHYHLLSPLSKGLFHKAIMQSGWAQNPWAFQPSPKKMAIKLAKRLGCGSEDPHQVLKFLQSLPSDSIVTASKELAKEKESMMCCGLVFSPCVEVAGSERFLPDTPNNLMKRGEYSNVPTILGVCQKEGSVHLLFALVNGISLEEIPAVMNNNPERLVPSFLGLKSGTAEVKQAQAAIWDFYFKGEPLSMENLSHYMNYQSDLLFIIGFGETRRYLLANSSAPTYSYLFTDHTKCIICSMFSSTLAADNSFAKYLAGPETCHGADLNFTFTLSNGMPTPELTTQFKEAISRYVGVWTKFALTGDPNCVNLGVTWDRDSETKPRYMDIGTAWDCKDGVPYADRIIFWEELSAKYSSN